MTRIDKRDIIFETCGYYGVPLENLKGPGKATKAATRTRMVIWWLLRKHTHFSSSEVAVAFQVDHSSVLYGIRKIEKLLENENFIESEINDIYIRIKNGKN